MMRGKFKVVGDYIKEKGDHLQIVVDCHFMIKPTGNEYWGNRQKILEAIYRAAEKTGVHCERLVRAV